ncbi:hypothetical protein [Hymenobacter glacialis]|uniref:Uncharacterized protein n=1 Tax=Hymenobacter glacialis TaxID=1908236 RepID=A0A1G1T7F6_9BACT|nr:hypothetical protein [Hymenobacter glacialis]OGX86810.1 hypothetical protein BEN48_00085 [Hymenobacter glacialis]
MKKYWGIFLLMSLALPAFSQGRDTVFAVRKLFYQKRGRGNGWLAAADSAASTTGYVQQSASRFVNVDKKPDYLGSTVFLLVGAARASEFSAENEAAIVRHYRAGGSIPPGIRRKLKRKHFHRTAQDVMNENID